jgi:hypothetical protein
VNDVHEFYTARLRPLLRSTGCPDWTRESIRGHLSGTHGTGQLAILKNRHRSFMGPLMETLRRNIVMQSTTGGTKRTRIDYRGLAEYRKMAIHLCTNFDET